MHQPDAWISQTTCCFGILLWNFFPVFHYKLRGVFYKSWSWTLLQWALFIFSPEWEIFIFGHSDPFFPSVFCYGYSSWAQFWLFNYPGIHILPFTSSMLDRMDFHFSSSEYIWFGHIKAITLS